MKSIKINESRTRTIGGIGFMFSVEPDPIRARFVPQTSDDLDKLNTEKNVKHMIAVIEAKLSSATGYAWNHDILDRGAGYSFLPNEIKLAESIEALIK